MLASDVAVARTPAFVRADVRSPAFKRDPLPTFARMRDAGSLVRMKIPVLGNLWVATTHDAVTELLSDHHRFVQSAAAAGNRWMAAALRFLPRTLRPLTTHMLLRDEPDHRRLRHLVDRAFRVRSIDDLRPHLETLADEAADGLAERASHAAAVDLLADFARPFPLAVICELLGLPLEDRPKFTKWVGKISSVSSPLDIVFVVHGLAKTTRYLRDEIARQSVRPRGGLIAALIEAEHDGDRLTDDELLAMVLLLLVAGHETTVHQIAGSALTLFDHPEALEALHADWSLTHGATEELLRHFSFAQFTKPRFAREDLVFQGQTIRRGEVLLGCLAAANADPSAFDHPERLDVRRTPNRHVAFGDGIHHCLGAALARAEVEIALRRLFTRFPNMALAMPRADVRFTGAFGARSLRALPVRLA